MAYTFRGGKSFKRYSADMKKSPIRDMSDCGEYIFFITGSGADLNPLVAAGENVKVSDKLADADNYECVPVISSVSGTVENIEERMHPNGRRETAVIIKSDGLFTLSERISAPAAELTPLEKLWLIREAGVTESDGTPSHTILGSKKAADYLILNGAECAPYSRSDYRRITENTDEVMDGFMAAFDIAHPRRGIIVLNTEMRAARQRIRQIIRYNDKLDIITVKNKYPQNSAENLAKTAAGRVVRDIKSCADAGVMILGAESLYNIAAALKTGMPVITKPVTVCGNLVASPANIRARIGAPVSSLFSECGGLKSETAKIIYGNQLYGTAWDRTDIPITASTACIAGVSSVPKAVSKKYLQ